ncbi:type IV pilin protein [Candidatus Avelusimicrobium sp.]
MKNASKAILKLLKHKSTSPGVHNKNREDVEQKKLCLTLGFSKGFTLIELLVVVLIIGILSSVALPQYNKAVWKSRTAQLYTAVRSLATAQEAYYLANGEYSKEFVNLDISFDGLKKKTDSNLGSVGSSDAIRYNENFELILNITNYFVFSFAVFRTGPYHGGGILFSHKANLSIADKQMYCVEVGSLLEEGEFCRKVVGLSSTAVSGNNARYYPMN